jgi:hypothetical protein
MRVALVPGVLALLPEYAGLTDPVAELRAACLTAVGWLGTEVTVLSDPQGTRVARHLLDVTEREGAEPSFLVVANGSARRGDNAPGQADERAFDFDDALRSWLQGEGTAPDADLGRELLAAMTGFELMAARVGTWGAPTVDYDDDPFGVQYWVMRWRL